MVKPVVSVIFALNMCNNLRKEVLDKSTSWVIFFIVSKMGNNAFDPLSILLMNCRFMLNLTCFV